MNDYHLVEALREREPDAPAAVYDTHADRIYRYCWFQLRSRDAAQVALRDTFIVAEARIGKLRDPHRFGPWLYAIARLECARRLPSRDQPPDVPIASHDQEDVDERIMAWQAVLALRPLSREILELHVRHQLSVPDLALVFDVSLKDAQSTLDAAHGELEGALTAEILAHNGPYGCADRALMLRERRGELVQELNSRLMEHAEGCSVCGVFRPRTVSAAKVYGLLPDADLPPDLRLRVMSCFLDPELVGYRLFVGTRITEFTSDGFPVQSNPSVQSLRARRSGVQFWLRRFRRALAQPKQARGSKPQAMEDVPKAAGSGAQFVRAAVVLVVVGLLSGGGIASMYGFSGMGPQRGRVAGPRPSTPSGTTEQPESGQPPAGNPDGSGSIDAVPVSATFPLGARTSSAPSTVLRPSSTEPIPVDEPSGSAANGVVMVSPLFLDLAGRSEGSISLRAHRGPVAWQATSRGPVRVQPLSGRLGAGQSITLRMYVNRQSSPRGDGTVTFQPGGSQLSVTWRPDTPATGPAPSPTPTRPEPGIPSTPPDTQRPSTSPSPSKTPPPSGPPPSDPPPSDDPSGPSPSTMSTSSSSPTTVSSPTSSPSGPGDVQPLNGVA